MTRFRVTRLTTWTLTLVALILPHTASAQVLTSSVNVFGQCAHSSSLDIKIAACTEASQTTSYPWILHWVYRELARAQRHRGEREKAIVSYARSLAARDDRCRWG
jgi:hypothetical protein